MKILFNRETERGKIKMTKGTTYILKDNTTYLTSRNKDIIFNKFIEIQQRNHNITYTDREQDLIYKDFLANIPTGKKAFWFSPLHKTNTTIYILNIFDKRY